MPNLRSWCDDAKKDRSTAESYPDRGEAVRGHRFPGRALTSGGRKLTASGKPRSGAKRRTDRRAGHQARDGDRQVGASTHAQGGEHHRDEARETTQRRTTACLAGGTRTPGGRRRGISKQRPSVSGGADRGGRRGRERSGPANGWMTVGRRANAAKRRRAGRPAAPLEGAREARAAVTQHNRAGSPAARFETGRAPRAP